MHGWVFGRPVRNHIIEFQDDDLRLFTGMRDIPERCKGQDKNRGRW
jgi:hypothetical protein